MLTSSGDESVSVIGKRKEVVSELNARGVEGQELLQHGKGSERVGALNVDKHL
jgi:hypothetical protein